MKSERNYKEKNATMIQARTILLGLWGKFGLHKYSQGHGKFEYSYKSALLDRQAQNTASEIDLLIYINHLENLEDRKSRFCDLQGMVFPDYVISPFENATELTDLEPNIGEQLFELRMDLVAKSLFTRSGFFYFVEQRIGEQ